MSATHEWTDTERVDAIFALGWAAEGRVLDGPTRRALLEHSIQHRRALDAALDRAIAAFTKAALAGFPVPSPVKAPLKVHKRKPR